MDAIVSSDFEELPGFRFHPTDQELLEFYLKKMVSKNESTVQIIRLLNIYQYHPRDLPELSKTGEREWYFFVPRERKDGSRGRQNRTTETGFWKATGSDKKIWSTSDPNRVIGLRKILVFYEGKAPKGTKTDWIMSEYRFPDDVSSLPKNIVVCKIYRKATSLKVLSERAAKEEDKIQTVINQACYSSPASTSLDTFSFCSQLEDSLDPVSVPEPIFEKRTEEVVIEEWDTGMFKNENGTEKYEGCSTFLNLPFGIENLGELELPKLGMEWDRESFWNLSPWLQNLSPYNILNI